MKILSAIMLLISCQQLLAAKMPSAVEMAHLKLSELKQKLDFDVAGLPPMPEFMFTSKKTNQPLGQVPDFEARVTQLAGLRAKLTDLQAKHVKSGKPTEEFHTEMQKALKESMNIKMMDVKVPKYTAKKAAAMKSKTAAVSDVGKVDTPRNVRNFTEEIYRLHEQATDFHRQILEDGRVERTNMVRIIGEIYDEMVEDLGITTENLWEHWHAVQAAIDHDEEIGAIRQCIDEQVARFNEINVYLGGDVSRCAYYVNARGNLYLQNIYYPIANEINLIGSVFQYLILGTTPVINIARDQEALIEFVENEFVALNLLWEKNIVVLLQWEENRYSDTMLPYQEELDECLEILEEQYAEETASIIQALNMCAVPSSEVKAVA